jgi:tetratricopeptide (TPR) repeat protein
VPTPKTRLRVQARPVTARRVRGARVEDADSVIARAMSLIKRGKHEEAAEQFLRASKLEPMNWRLPNDAGECYFLAGRYVEALRCYSSAMMMMPDMSTVLFNRGLAQSMLGEEDEAFVTFQNVLELDREHAGAYLETGKLHAAAGRHWDAVDSFDAALRQTSTDARLASVALREKARLLLGPLQREPEGLAVVQALWERFRDHRVILDLAKDILDSTKPRAARVLDVLLADLPTDKKALALRAKLARPS